MAKVLLNLVVATLIWVAVLFMVALAGGVGTVELTLWAVCLPILLAVVYRGSRRRDRVAGS